MINPGDVEILLAEDSAIQAEILRRKLVQEGYQVSVAGNGAKALAMVRKAKQNGRSQVQVMAQDHGL